MVMMLMLMMIMRKRRGVRRIMVAAKLMEHLILTQAQPILQSYREEPQSDWS